jgi:hypothetical protein
MAQHIETKEQDLSKNWVATSRFFFYVQVFCIMAFLLGGCYRLYQHRWQGKPDISTAPPSSNYTPQYNEAPKP